MSNETPARRYGPAPRFTKAILVRLTPEDREWVRRQAEARNIPETEVVRNAVTAARTAPEGHKEN